MDKRDIDKIIQLTGEGKPISKIWEENFPEYDYWEIYCTAYDAGERSSVGTRRMITNRLNKLATCSVAERQSIINEIDDLVWYLYNRYKDSQHKLDKIREIIE